MIVVVGNPIAQDVPGRHRSPVARPRASRMSAAAAGSDVQLVARVVRRPGRRLDAPAPGDGGRRRTSPRSGSPPPPTARSSRRPTSSSRCATSPTSGVLVLVAHDPGLTRGRRRGRRLEPRRARRRSCRAAPRSRPTSRRGDRARGARYRSRTARSARSWVRTRPRSTAESTPATAFKTTHHRRPATGRGSWRLAGRARSTSGDGSGSMRPGPSRRTSFTSRTTG